MYIMYLLHTKTFLVSQKDFRMCLIPIKGIEFLPQTLISLSLYLCNTIEFVAKTQFLWLSFIYIYICALLNQITLKKTEKGQITKWLVRFLKLEIIKSENPFCSFLELLKYTIFDINITDKYNVQYTLVGGKTVLYSQSVMLSGCNNIGNRY